MTIKAKACLRPISKSISLTEKNDLTDTNQFNATTCSRREAAAYLGVSTRTFDRIQKTKAIAYVRVGQRRRYLQSDLDNYLKSNRSI